MARSGPKKRVYVCGECGADYPRWSGKCQNCGEMNTLQEMHEPKQPVGSRRRATTRKPIVRVRDVPAMAMDRMRTGIPDFDYVMGGGIVPASVTLLGGPPGIGKSTISTQIADWLTCEGVNTLYVAGEETARQVRIRTDRLSPTAGDIRLVEETCVEALIEQMEEERPQVVVIDSIQTMWSETADQPPGSITQVRRSGSLLRDFAKEHGVSVVLIGHVTKEGEIAGPMGLEHAVDTTLHFEESSEFGLRILRSTKNRFGSVREIGIFTMEADGLHPVPNPSDLFLAERSRGISGSVVTGIMGGRRSVLVEVQALVASASYGSPQRVATGYGRQRLAMLLGVLEKRGGVAGLSGLDVFLNMVGGVDVADRTVEAAIAIALISSAVDRPISPDVMVLGEIGLGGELRRVQHLDQRLHEAVRCGFKRAVVGGRDAVTDAPSGIEVVQAEHLGNLIRHTLGDIESLLKPGKTQAPTRRGAAGVRREVAGLGD